MRVHHHLYSIYITPEMNREPVSLPYVTFYRPPHPPCVRFSRDGGKMINMNIDVPWYIALPINHKLVMVMLSKIN